MSFVLEEHKSLEKMNTWKLPGTARYYAAPRTEAEVCEVVRFANEHALPLITMGNGSNVFVDKEWFPGVVVHLNKHLKSITVNEARGEVFVYAGMALPALAANMARRGVEGFEFFAGIPGTVGGAVAMNAGCIGKETKGILRIVTYVNEDGEIIHAPVEETAMNFRTSMFLHRPVVILGGYFQYKYAEDPEAVQAKTKEAMEIRRRKFPKGVATVGSTFKSPPSGPFPGKLIEEAGLKGYEINHAKISDKHGNWVINTGGASAESITELMDLMHGSVLKTSGVNLEPEVVYMSGYRPGRSEDSSPKGEKE